MHLVIIIIVYNLLNNYSLHPIADIIFVYILYPKFYFISQTLYLEHY